MPQTAKSLILPFGQERWDNNERRERREMIFMDPGQVGTPLSEYRSNGNGTDLSDQTTVLTISYNPEFNYSPFSPLTCFILIIIKVLYHSK